MLLFFDTFTPIEDRKGNAMPSKSKDHKDHIDKPNVVEKKRDQHPMLWAFSVFILVLIVVTFVGAPAISHFGSQRGSIVFGSWNGEPIEYRPDNYLSRQRDMVAKRYQAMFQQSQGQDNIDWQLFQVWNGAFELTVIHSAIMEEAKKSGLQVSDERVDRALTYYEGYWENGKFSPEAYRNTPSSEKFSVRNYYHESLIHQQWVGDVFSTRSSSAEKAFLLSLASPERNFRFVNWDLNSYPAEKVAEYGREKGDLFAEGSFSRISLKDDKKSAEAVLKQLREETSTFEELATAHSTDIYADKGGEMGYVMRYALQSDISNDKDLDEVFSLAPGAASGLVETPYGWAIYRSNGPIRDADFTNDETIDKVRSYMLVNDRGIVEDYFLDLGKTFGESAEKSSFSETSDTMGLTEHLTDYFPINFGSVGFLKVIRTLDNSNYLQSIGSNDRILKLLFSLEPEGVSEPQVVGNNVIVFQMIDERDAPQTVKDTIDQRYRSVITNMTDDQVRRLFLGSKKLENNFMEVFSTRILNRG
jgi:hypothetical protein